MKITALTVVKAEQASVGIKQAGVETKPTGNKIAPTGISADQATVRFILSPACAVLMPACRVSSVVKAEQAGNRNILAAVKTAQSPADMDLKERKAPLKNDKMDLLVPFRAIYPVDKALYFVKTAKLLFRRYITSAEQFSCFLLRNMETEVNTSTRETCTSAKKAVTLPLGATTLHHKVPALACKAIGLYAMVSAFYDEPSAFFFAPFALHENPNTV